MATAPRVSYGFYRDVYGGHLISVDDWSWFCSQAATRMDKIRSVATVTEPTKDALKMAICSVAEIYKRYKDAWNGDLYEITSEKIGEVSESYGAGPAASADWSDLGRDRVTLAAAREYVDIYKGVRK